MKTRRPGVALAELLVAGAVASVVLVIGALLWQAQSGLSRRATVRSEINDAARGALLTLRAELRHLVLADIRAVSADSVFGRIFRGVGIVCGFRGSDTYLQYEGLRLPDPAKDSALQAGLDNVAAVLAIRPDSSVCAPLPNRQVLVWRAGWNPPPGSAWLFFETGGYHLANDALRYRVHGSARQPMTNQVFDHTRSSFALAADSVARMFAVALLVRSSGAQFGGHIYLTNGR